MRLEGVETFLTSNKIGGDAADIIRAWAKESMYWNAFFLLHPADIAVQVMGAPDARELEERLEGLIEEKLGLSQPQSQRTEEK